jgi:hypothetical protein
MPLKTQFLKPIRSLQMKRLTIAIFLCLLFIPCILAQNFKATPSDTVIKFYRALKEKKYVEGFHLSVYRGAIEGLSAAEMKDLEPDFIRTFSAIPDKIEVKGEQLNGNTAVVFLKFEGIEKLEQVALIAQGNEWLVGDQESLELVKAQGRNFFFNTRMIVNEEEANEMLQRILNAEFVYASKFEGRNASIAELVKLQGLPKDMEDEESSGYKFSLTLSEDKRTFHLNATPVVYGKTGKLSFYADIEGIHAEDLKGKPASNKSPIYQPKS